MMWAMNSSARYIDDISASLKDETDPARRPGLWPPAMSTHAKHHKVAQCKRGAITGTSSPGAAWGRPHPSALT
eukprot:CAMPEP_0182526832 /NCGR_PEP_ID=MMETSP1323-20130603/3474_1 /TAXON_ID=236787 /ORGANISM="Florenciella parvula, Strain RCC1693" /LENGTH=72 /DNA_ID=CAMNT_0024735755 /DNA_START=90 /DNA_END=305 /DNA_ORIENTATION=-